MIVLRHILRLFVFLLFSALGVNTAFAAPMNISEISFYQAENTLFTQAADVGFAARAPPLAVSYVEITSGVTAMHGGAFALHGQETVAALFGFGAHHNATNNAGQFTRTYADGTFSVSDWSGYPTGVPKPPAGSTYRLLSGAEYQEARRLANNANARLRREGVVPEGHEIHEIIPVKYGGIPTDLRVRMADRNLLPYRSALRSKLPFTETGYKSHFMLIDQLAEYESYVEFVKIWLDDAGKKSTWINHVEAARQGDLFEI